MDPGEEIVRLAVLANGRNFGTTSFSTTADSSTITFSDDKLGLLDARDPGNDVDDSFTYTFLTGPSAVPEPSTLIGGGIAGLGWPGDTGGPAGRLNPDA